MCPEGEEILVNGNEYICAASHSGAQDGQIVRISASGGRDLDRNNYLGSADDGLTNFRDLILRKAELLSQLPGELAQDEFGDHQLVSHQYVFEKLSAYAGTADVGGDEHGRVEQRPHASPSLRNTSSSV